MTSSQIRRSFLDFFKSKEHTLVPSASLLPDSPNLLFTNAGMNQFVPIFLGQKRPDVSRWAGAVAGRDTRAADTQKCIRAGGKHNDLEDVGLDTYHHTFFEMLGNWSFGDYFKQEAIEWAWELVVQQWGFPPQRLYATVYKPGPGEPAEFDQEAYAHWERLFRAVGLDPAVHVRTGGKKDNFWMMGDTGPCGPCSELHVDLSPGPRETAAAAQQAGAELVNRGTPRCIEIWNLVFIQFNANPDGSFSPLPARHVDTGMGFERVTSIIQGTKGLTDFAHARVSNYETDIFRPLFDRLEELSGRRYGSTLPVDPSETADLRSQVATDVAFRVIADHIRTLGFAVADGLLPSNEGRGYVLRRILRRAVRYGRTLGFHEPFFHKLVGVLADTMGDVFPEIRARRSHVEEVIRVEEEAFNKTLDRGIELFEEEVAGLSGRGAHAFGPTPPPPPPAPESGREGACVPCLSGDFAFKLYDTYGFPLDLTELMARERGLTVDVEGVNRLMEEQRARARAAQKRTVVELSQIETATPTRFVGYDTLETPARVLEVVQIKDQTAVILDTSACYAEMGGQVGDTGRLQHGSRLWRVANTQKSGLVWLHLMQASDSADPADASNEPPAVGSPVTLAVDRPRREAIQRHHTVTHLLHWALREVVGRDLSQKGSFVGPDKLTFDFNSAPLTPEQVADVERLVNERILEDAGVSWLEVKYDHIRHRPDIMQFFGEKYGDWVRVVQVGGKPGALDGYAMELCGGTHTRSTGQIGLFRIVSENAIATGVRRIEAVAGLEAYRQANAQLALLKTVAGRVNTPLHELDKRIENLLAQLKTLEKQLRAAQQKEAAGAATALLAKAATVNGIPAIIERFDADADTLQGLVNELKGRFQGVILLGGAAHNAVALVAAVSPQFTAKVQAGRLIQQIAPLVGGKGGGRPDNARGGGKDVAKLDEAIARARALVG